MSIEQPFTQFAKDDYKKELENRLVKLKEDLELVIQKKSGGTRSKRIKHLNVEINRVSKELFGLDGFNSFVDKNEQLTNNNLHLNESQLNSGLFCSPF